MVQRAVRDIRLTEAGCATLHFLVDGLCACCLFLLADGASGFAMLGVFIIYNVLAFLTQPLTGMLADRLRQPELLLPGAVALLALGVVSTIHHPLSTSLFLGMGNSFFHVWGGRQVAVATGNDIRVLGVFVSTGAFGLAVGMVFHSWWLLYGLLAAIALIAIGLLHVLPRQTVSNGVTFQKGISSKSWLAELTVVTVDGIHQHGLATDPQKVTRLKPWLVWCIVLLLMAFVIFRSFVGETFTSGLVKGGSITLLIGTLAMAGKALGGWVVRGTIGFVLVLAGVLACLWLQPTVLWLWLPGLLLINGTMAITLYWANATMPGREGLAFGLLAAALMPGYLLAQVPHFSFLIPHLLLTLAPTVVIECVVLWSLRERRADVLGSSVVVNLLTNVPLHLFVVFVSSSVAAIVVGEVLVVVIEMLWYRYFVASWRQAFVYSFLCNGISCLLGLLVTFIVQLLTI